MAGKQFQNEKPITLPDVDSGNWYEKHLRTLDFSKFPLIVDFEVKTKDTEFFGPHVYYYSAEHGRLASFPDWDSVEQDLQKERFLDIAKEQRMDAAYIMDRFPLGTIDRPYNELEQGWRLVSWEDGEFVYVLETNDEHSNVFPIWFKVSKDRYMDEWKKLVDAYRNIGLKRGAAKLFPHNPRWAQYFEWEKDRLTKALGTPVLAIEHIGSTAVPGLSAKPIIDILVGVERLSDVEGLKVPLEELGYEYRANGSNAEQEFFARGQERRRTDYLHITEFNSPMWKRDLAFRDYLRAHPEVAKQYEELKTSLAKKHESERALYTEGKAEFIKSILKLAQ
jgi:GrpB-like predicted nucleotidyltransferase (UPF0157 family)